MVGGIDEKLRDQGNCWIKELGNICIQVIWGFGNLGIGGLGKWIIL